MPNECAMQNNPSKARKTVTLALAFLGGWLAALAFVHLAPQGQRPTPASVSARAAARTPANQPKTAAPAASAERDPAPVPEAAPCSLEAPKASTDAKAPVTAARAPAGVGAAAAEPVPPPVVAASTGAPVSNDAEAERLRERDVTKALFSKNRDNLRLLNSH
jgi:hypothetical protein